MSFSVGSTAVPPPSGSNVFLEWNGSAFVWVASTSGIDSSGNITPNALTWGAGATSPTIQHTAAASGAGQNMTAAPQAATTTGASGSWAFTFAAPASGTAEAGLWLERAGTFFSIHSARPGFPTISSQWWYGPNAAAPSGSNIVLEAQASLTYLNNPSKVALTIAATEVFRAQSTALTTLVPFLHGPASVSIAAGGTVVVTPTTTFTKLTGSIPNNTIVQLPANDGQEFILDTSGVTFNAHTISFQANAVTSTITHSAAGVVRFVYSAGVGKLMGTNLTA